MKTPKVSSVGKAKKAARTVAKKAVGKKLLGGARAKTAGNPAQGWTAKEEAILRKLRSPADIQKFLDSLAYDPDDLYLSVRATLRLRKAHCMGGAMLAGYCLQRLGFGPPQVVGFDAINDDDHAIAVYKVGGYWGAIGKSNFTCIRSRDPVYKSLRELMMSYFDFYFNSKGEKSLISYRAPFNLARVKSDAWLFAEGSCDEALEAANFDEQPRIPLLPRGFSKKRLLPASKDLLKAGMLGSNPAGLYKPT